ncbi:serine hydrolase [Bradyrhizobium sp. CCBAU 53338]|uniref:serine hydrolase domain-containing protein n=1 Tax=Bradyrhizobium sp. CCBAU 53338 TaxID=1325111 RepID=UPI00188ABFDD|nr:serine hydrolase domain-containing protein [Bradyrhizobium sp. CCBAU 53338]QOZ52484.1 serine hydrolase [Bradyrhizobium sp. CCBAU 53338]
MRAPIRSRQRRAAFSGKLVRVLDEWTPHRIRGAVVLVAHEGEIVEAICAGFRDLERQALMQVDTRFRYASLTKVFISAIALMLVEEGAFNLTDPVSRYLPFFEPRGPDGCPAAITIAHLLTHTAGLDYGFCQSPDGAYRQAGISDGLDLTNMPLRENLRRLATIPLSFMPGAAWQYSLATDVIGAAIEATTGCSLGEVLRSRLLHPLSLNSVAFTAIDRNDLASVYYDTADAPRRIEGPQHVRHNGGELILSPERCFLKSEYPSGGTGLLGNARDFLRLLEEIRTGRNHVLSGAVRDRLSQNAIGDLPALGLDPGWRFSHGFAILESPERARVPFGAGTWRWGGVYGHHWFVDTAEDLAVVVLTNTTPSGMNGDFPLAVRDAVYCARK